MIFPFLKPKRLLAGVFAAMALSVHGQAAMPSGVAISFSSPDQDGMSSNLPSLAPRPAVLSGFAGAVQAPSLNLNGPSNSGPGPAPRPPLSALEIEKLDKEKNWSLMTPEEIMGVKTPEDIMQISMRSANGQLNNKSVMERYLDRQELRQNPTNELVGAGSSEWDRPERQTNSFFSAPSIEFTPQAGDSIFPEMVEMSAAQPRNKGDGLANFGSSSATPDTLTPEQVAANESFQKLIEPRSALPEKDAANGNFFAPPMPTPDALLSKRESPFGQSFAPLSGNIGQPIAVKPLPELIRKQDSTAPIAPSWAPQPPPWMSSTPQLGMVPQRKF